MVHKTNTRTSAGVAWYGVSRLRRFLHGGRIQGKTRRAMPTALELQRLLSGLRITAEAASEDELPRQHGAHYYGHTGDIPPVGSQWAWARHWIRCAHDEEDPCELTNDPEIRRIIHFLSGCDDCAFAAPVADHRPDTQRLPPSASWNGGWITTRLLV